MNLRGFLSGAVIAAGAIALSGPTLAQNKYPDRPVKVIVALPPGGGVDMIARVVGQQLATMTGQPFIIDNRAGASGRIGLPLVTKAPPDGYTLTVAPAGFLVTNKSLFKSMPYDSETDFAPITKLANQALVLVVKDRQKFPTVAAVLAAARAKDGAVTYASSGDGSPQHVAALMFESRAKVNMTHVAYKGGALALNDLLGGNVDVLFAPMPEALPFIKAGKLAALAIMSDRRSSLVPDVPTMQESGFKDMVMVTWIGMLAPAGTPRPVVDQLNKQVLSILADEEVKKRLIDAGMDIAPTTPEQFRALISQEIRQHAELVKAAGVEMQ